MKNTMKAKLNAGQVVLGAQLRLGTPSIAEIFGYAGFDYIIFDSEHAPQTPVGIQLQMQAMSSTEASPIVRIFKNDADLMRPYLDMGAVGILAPFVNTAEEAKYGADALRYPPVGTRGCGPSRAAKYGFDADYFKTANDEMIYLPIIEDVRAVKNIDAILAVKGVDSFVIGPVDLSISLGVPMQLDSPVFKDAIKTVEKAAQAAKKPMGTAIYGGDMFEADTYRRFIDRGYHLLLVGGDEWMLNTACKKLVNCVAGVKG